MWQLALAAVVIVYFSYALMFSAEPPSTMLSIVYVLAIIANLIFIGTSLWSRRG
jgi:hypothetical protein